MSLKGRSPERFPKMKVRGGRRRARQRQSQVVKDFDVTLAALAAVGEAIGEAFTAFADKFARFMDDLVAVMRCVEEVDDAAVSGGR